MKALIILIILVEISERRWYNWNGSEKSKQIYCQEGKEVK